MRFHAFQCVRCLRTSAVVRQRGAVEVASVEKIPLHARPQPQAGPSKPSLLTRVASKQRSVSLPSLVQAPLPSSPIDNLERALQSNHLTSAYEIQRHLDQERIPLSARQHLRIQRAWAIHSARYSNATSNQRLPRYLLSSVLQNSSEINQETLLDLIRCSLRSPPPHPTLSSILSAFPPPKYNSRRILHQYLHPDLSPDHPKPNPSALIKHGIQPTSQTLHLYLRNLSRKRQRSKRAIALLILFEKRWKVFPSDESWRLVVRFTTQERDQEVARWVLRTRGGRGLRSFWERRGLIVPLDHGRQTSVEFGDGDRDGDATEIGNEVGEQRDALDVSFHSNEDITPHIPGMRKTRETPHDTSTPSDVPRHKSEPAGNEPKDGNVQATTNPLPAAIDISYMPNVTPASKPNTSEPSR